MQGWTVVNKFTQEGVQDRRWQKAMWLLLMSPPWSSNIFLAHVVVDTIFMDRTMSKIWNSSPPRGSNCFLVNHLSGCSNRWVACEKGWHEWLQGLQSEFGGHHTLFVEFLACPRSLDEELKNLGSVRGWCTTCIERNNYLVGNWIGNVVSCVEWK